MALAFRNLNVTPDSPVSEWPTEAIQTALERGDLVHWHRIVVELEREPWGGTARQVEEVLGYTHPYGIAEAMATVLDRIRRRTEAAERATVAAEIQQTLADSGLSRAAFASRIGTSVSRLSTYLSGKVTPSAALMVRIRNMTRP